MNDFLTALPWWLASLAAILVGFVCLAAGKVDTWIGFERAGFTFVAFFVIGLLARALLSTGTDSQTTPSSKNSASNRNVSAVGSEPNGSGEEANTNS